MDKNEVKPEKTPFILFPLLINLAAFALIILIVPTIILYFLNLPLSYPFILYIVLMSIIYLHLSKKYQKERYIFKGDKIIMKTGGIFADKETELIITNITHVELKLPYIRNKLFGVGDINVESAGTGKSEVKLSSIANPKEMYEYIEQIMKANGFKLKKDNLLQQEKPNKIGVFFETMKKFFSGILIAIIILINIFAETDTEMETILEYQGIFIIVLIFIILIFLTRSILNYLDLKNRIYDVYQDVITYNEGFLSKNYSFIPIENLTDSTVTQTFIDKIFNLYDVKISCQGAGQEILFKNIKNAMKLEETIDGLIAKTEALIGKKTATVKKVAEYKEKPLKTTSFTADFKMDMKRTIIPYLPLFLIFFLGFLWIIMIIALAIKASVTSYSIKANSITEKYNFLTRKDIEFTNDKITAIIIKESFIDKLFKTCSIVFTSIGSSQVITFKNIKKTNTLYNDILSKTGIKPQEELYHMDSKFSFLNMLKATLWLTIILLLILSSLYIWTAIVMPALLLFVIPITLFWTIIFYTIMGIYKSAFYKRSKMVFYKDYIRFQKGIFFKSFYYVKYSNIKDIHTLKYPFTDRGSIKFNIAGDVRAQKGKDQSIMSNDFTIRYIEDIETKDELIDYIFFKRPGAKEIPAVEQTLRNKPPTSLLSSKPVASNSVLVVSLILFLITAFSIPVLYTKPLVFTFFVPVVAFIIIITVWEIKVKSYAIQSYRVLERGGILYKSQSSIVFNKIDHINLKQGVLSKMFKNGSITVNTTGSSRPELTVSDIPNYKEFYEELKKHY